MICVFVHLVSTNLPNKISVQGSVFQHRTFLAPKQAMSLKSLRSRIRIWEGWVGEGINPLGEILKNTTHTTAILKHDESVCFIVKSSLYKGMIYHL